MVNLIPVGGGDPEGTATEDDVLEGETFSSAEAGENAEGTIPDQGSLSISSPGPDEPAGYYPNGVENNITDRGSIDDLDPGDFGGSGYYSSGSVSSCSTSMVLVDEQSVTGSEDANVDYVDEWYAAVESNPDAEEVEAGIQAQESSTFISSTEEMQFTVDSFSATETVGAAQGISLESFGSVVVGYELYQEEIE